MIKQTKKPYIKLILILTVTMIAVITGCAQEPSVNIPVTVYRAERILYDQIQNGSRAIRETIVRLTGGMKSGTAIPLLEMAIDDPEPKIADAALEKMLEFKDPALTDTLKEVLGDRFDREILNVLSELKVEDVIPNIERGLRSLRPFERADALLYLERIKGDDARETIEQYLDDEELLVRLKARHAMARIGDESFLEDVGDLLQSGDMIRTAQGLALAKEFDLREYRDDVAEIARETSGPVGDHALEVLYSWDDEEASDILIRRIESPHATVMTLYGALNLVDEYKDKNALPVLNNLLSSSVPQERYSAARLILTVDPENNPHVLAFLLRGMQSEVPAIREQVAITFAKLPGFDEVRTALERKGLQDESLRVVEMSMLALGKVGDKVSIAYLEPFLESDNMQLRVTAAAAIINIAERVDISDDV